MRKEPKSTGEEVLPPLRYFASFFCLHHLRHEVAHRLCGFALLLPRSVGVGAECESSVIVAEHTADGFDVHPILIAAVMLFCAQSVGMTLTLSQIINMVVVATIVTSGSPGVPGGGISRLMIVAATMGLPLEIIAMISAFYRCFDMGTTTMSVMGDLSASIVIDRWEKKATQKAVKE